HHLIATEVGGGDQLEACGHVVELEAVILPDAQPPRLFRVVLPETRLRVFHARKDRIIQIGDEDEAILILEGAARAVLVLRLIIERDDVRAEAQADQLMSAADAEHRRARLADEAGETFKERRTVEIEIGERAAQDNRVGLIFVRSRSDFRQVRDSYLGPLHKALDVVAYVRQRKVGDLALAAQV